MRVECFCIFSQRIGGRPCCQGSTWSWWWGRGDRRWTWRWTLKCLRPGWRYYFKCRRMSQMVYKQSMPEPYLTTWTLLLYSSTKEPRANLNLLSGLTDQFMLNTVHGASYLRKWCFVKFFKSLEKIFRTCRSPSSWEVRSQAQPLWTQTMEILKEKLRPSGIADIITFGPWGSVLRLISFHITNIQTIGYFQ